MLFGTPFMPNPRPARRSVDYRKTRIDLPGALRDIPAVELAEEVDISDERPILVPVTD